VLGQVSGMRRRLAWLLPLLLLGGAGVGLYLYLRSDHKPQARFETMPVDRGRIVARLVASGTLNPLVTVQVGSQVSGRIKALNADFNSTVKKGQVVARIDPQLFQAALEQARANVLAGEANLARARVQAAEADRQHARTKALAGRQLVAPAEEETARATLESARAQVIAAQAALAQARAALNQARVNLAYTTIVSPIDGVVISRNVDVGQTVAASLQAPTLFTIAEDLSKMQVYTNVAEADIGRVRPAMTVSFSVDAYPREHFAGRVQQIRNAPQTVQNVVTYNVVVDVENPELKLKPGMTANVTFVYSETAEVLRVPNAALRFRPPPGMLPPERKATGGASAATRPRDEGTKRPHPASAVTAAGAAPDLRSVWVLRGGEPRQLRIRVGLSDGTMTEVKDGPLREGDDVIVDAAGTAKAGGPPGHGPKFGGGRGVIRRL
jgi:HlyD family secretion protein